MVFSNTEGVWPPRTSTGGLGQTKSECGLGRHVLHCRQVRKARRAEREGPEDLKSLLLLGLGADAEHPE